MKSDEYAEDMHEGKYYDPSRKNKYLQKTKKCSSCGKVKPLTEEYFSRHAKSHDGFMATCNECRKKRSMNYQEKKLEHDSNHSIYNWVKSLPEDLRQLLDQDAIAKKIMKELFSS